MEVHFHPDLERKLAELATLTGRPADDLVHDVVAGYFKELAGIRETLDRRCQELRGGRVLLIDSGEALARLRRKSDQRRPPDSA